MLCPYNSLSLLESPNPLHRAPLRCLQLITQLWPQCLTSLTLAIKSSPVQDDSVVRVCVNQRACASVCVCVFEMACLWCKGAHRGDVGGEVMSGSERRKRILSTYSLTLISNPLQSSLSVSLALWQQIYLITRSKKLSRRKTDRDRNEGKERNRWKERTGMREREW